MTSTQPQIDEGGTAEIRRPDKPATTLRTWNFCGSLFVNLLLRVRPSSVPQSAVPQSAVACSTFLGSAICGSPICGCVFALPQFINLRFSRERRLFSHERLPVAPLRGLPFADASLAPLLRSAVLPFRSVALQRGRQIGPRHWASSATGEIRHTMMERISESVDRLAATWGDMGLGAPPLLRWPSSAAGQ